MALPETRLCKHTDLHISDAVINNGIKVAPPVLGLDLAVKFPFPNTVIQVQLIKEQAQENTGDQADGENHTGYPQPRTGKRPV